MDVLLIFEILNKAHDEKRFSDTSLAVEYESKSFLHGRAVVECPVRCQMFDGQRCAVLHLVVAQGFRLLGRFGGGRVIWGRAYVRLAGRGPDDGAALVLSRWRFLDVFAAEAGQRIELHFEIRFAQNVRNGPVGCALIPQRCQAIADGYEHRMAFRRRCGVGVGICRF